MASLPMNSSGTNVDFLKCGTWIALITLTALVILGVPLYRPMLPHTTNPVPKGALMQDQVTFALIFPWGVAHLIHAYEAIIWALKTPINLDTFGEASLAFDMSSPIASLVIQSLIFMYSLNSTSNPSVQESNSLY